MSKFATKTRPVKPDRVNEAGGEAYSVDPRLEVATAILTSFGEDKFYESGGARVKRLQQIIKSDPFHALFFMKAAIMARRWGMRTMPVVVAAEVLANHNGYPWLKNGVYEVIQRPDDAIELLSYWKQFVSPVIPNQMKKGIAKKMAEFGPYQLAKYIGSGKDVNLYDVVALSHARGPSIDMLMRGELEAPDTWEVAITRAGKDTFQKAVEWERLIREEKLGYFALLRNLRNIEAYCDEQHVQAAAEQLVNPEAILHSKVLPFRFVTAYNEVTTNVMRYYISTACDIALRNVPKLDGRTCVMLDLSGSMSGRPLQIGSMFATALAKRNLADLVVFGSDAHYAAYNPATPIIEARHISACMGGTNFHAAFQVLSKPYDRIVILSDQEAWEQYKAAQNSRRAYENTFRVKPHLWVFDLQGYGTSQFPENSTYFMAGWSEKVFDLMPIAEKGPQGIIKFIEEQVTL